MRSTRWRPTCLALWLTLCATLAAAQVPAPADTIPGPDASLAHVLEAGTVTPRGVAYWFPRARGEMQEILARSIRRQAALEDTVSALNRAALDAASAAGAREDSLTAVLNTTMLRLGWIEADRPSWWETWGLPIGAAALAGLSVWVGATAAGN